jgi:hypothetical protein
MHFDTYLGEYQEGFVDEIAASGRHPFPIIFKGVTGGYFFDLDKDGKDKETPPFSKEG